MTQKLDVIEIENFPEYIRILTSDGRELLMFGDEFPNKIDDVNKELIQYHLDNQDRDDTHRPPDLPPFIVHDQ